MLFGLFINKWSRENVTQVWKITVHNNLFHYDYLFFAIADLKKFTWCNVIQQIKKVSPKL